MQPDSRKPETPRFKWLVLPLVWGMLAWVAFFMFYAAYCGIRDGQIGMGGYRGTGSFLIKRSDQPKLFWLGVALHTYLGLLVTAMGVWGVVDEMKQKRRTSHGTVWRAFQVRFDVRKRPPD